MSKFNRFISNSYYLKNLQFDSSRSVNLMVEVDENQSGMDGNVGQLIQTPGKTNTGASFSGNYIRGSWQTTNGLFYFASGNQVYNLTETGGVFSATSVGTLLTNSGPVNFADNAGILVIVDGENGYGYQNGVFTQIVDPAWQGANFVCVYDDYFLFNVPGTNQFYWSDLNSLTFTVNGGYGVDAKQGNSDPIVGMMVFARILWLIGSQDTEMWVDNPDGNTTFQRIPGPYLQIGCLAPQTCCWTEYGGIWLSTNPRGGAIVVMTPSQGYSASRISTFSIEQVLSTATNDQLKAATGFTYTRNGHTFFQLNVPGLYSSWVYDITMTNIIGEPCWHERTYTDANNNESRDRADNHAMLNGYSIVGDYNLPKLYYYNDDDFTDDGLVITRTRIPPHVSSSFNRVFHNAITIECRTGVGTQCGPLTPPGAPGGNDSCGMTSTPTLTWTASTVGSNPLQSYVIYRSTDGVNYNVLASVATDVFTYNDTTATNPSLTYSYYIKAVDSIGIQSSASHVQECSQSVWSLKYTYNGTGNSNGSSFQDIVSDDAGVYSYVVGAGSGQSASSSDGGNTWAPNSTYPGDSAQVFFNGTYFVSLDTYTGKVYFTTDLNTWTTNNVNYSAYQMFQDTGTGAIYMAPYTAPPNANLFRNAPNSNVFTQIITNAPGPNLSTYGTGILTVGGVTVSAYGQYPTFAPWYSTDEGVTWTQSPTTIDQDFFGLTYTGSLWMLLASELTSPYASEVWTSTNGINWTNVFSSVSGPPYENEIVGFNGLFYSFQGGSLASSADGVTWTPITVGTLTDIFGITAGTRLYIYGPQGMWESTDGVTFVQELTAYTNAVESAGDTLAIACLYGSAPDYVYKRNPT